MIPRLIHRIWLGGDEPDWLRRLGETWAAQHPGWQLIQWDDGNVAELFPLTNQRIYDQASVICPNHVGQLRADVLRYELLGRFGGLYVDADFEARRPLDELIDGFDCFATWEAQDRWVANGLMGAVADHRFIHRLIDGLEASIRPGARPAQITGPQYLTRMHRVWPGELTVLPQRLFYPFGAGDVAQVPLGTVFDDPEVYAVHWWHNQRRERGLLT